MSVTCICESCRVAPHEPLIHMEDAYITGLLPERFNQMLLVESGLDSDKVKEEEIWITDDLRFFSHKEVYHQGCAAHLFKNNL